jgi:DNA repair protein RecO (recombination protein O)
MQWKDEGFILSKKKYGENSIIIEVFTSNHGKCSGIVYGGTSRKINNYLQLGNKIQVILKTKNENRLGYFKIEIIDAISPFFFDDNKKLNCLLSSLELLKITLPELLSYNSIFVLFSNFLNELMFNKNWIIHYIFWEINFLKEIGFDMSLRSNLVSENYSKKNMSTVYIDNEKISIPSFMVENKFEDVDVKSIYHALKLIGKFLEKNILIPNNLNYPVSRKSLERFFK